MKVLKKIKDGLISHQILSEKSKVEEPLYIDGRYKYTNDCVELYDGIIYFYIEDNKKLVFEIIDNFIPTNEYDVGGISVISGDRIHNLYQYENSEEGIKYNYVRVTKILNSYYGEGSANGLEWYDKGRRFLKDADTIGVTYEESGVFPLKEIKVYRDPSWYIHGLYEGYTLEVYDEQESNLLYTTTVDNTNIAKITNVLYPNNFKVKIYDTDNNIITNFLADNVWGGDEYYISYDVELYNHNRILLLLEEAKHLGTLNSAELRELIYIVNKSELDCPVTVRVMKDSPVYDMIELEYLSTRGKEVYIPLKPLEEQTFEIIITKPSNMNITDLKTENVFYLELV